MQPGFPITVRNMGEFFMRTDPVHKALTALSRRLEEEGIAYALIGGMALGYHGFVRVTQDIDLLLTNEGLQKFRDQLVGRGYIPLFPGANKHFKDSIHGVNVEVITAGEYAGDGKPKEVIFPDPTTVSESIDGLNVVRLETLIELKLASGLTAPHRIRDLADVQQLIETLNLPEDLADNLKPSVRPEYLRLWKITRAARLNQDAPGRDPVGSE